MTVCIVLSQQLMISTQTVYLHDISQKEQLLLDHSYVWKVMIMLQYHAYQVRRC